MVTTQNNITPSLYNYFFICKRKVWLSRKGIRLEADSDKVALGKFTHENTYKKRPHNFKEIDLGFAKIDYFDAKNNIVHEIKQSSAMQEAHIAQLKYYLYLLQINNIAASGILEYPTERKTETVILTNGDLLEIKSNLIKIEKLSKQESCPSIPTKAPCHACAYQYFCYSTEN